MIIRRERVHPARNLSPSIASKRSSPTKIGPIPVLERDHRGRGRGRVEDHIRNDKDSRMRNLPFRDFAHNQAWLQIVGLAHNLIADPSAAARRRTRQGRTKAPELPIAPRRVPCPHRDPAPTRLLALGTCAHRRVQEAQDASCADLGATAGHRPRPQAPGAHAPREAGRRRPQQPPDDTGDRSARGRADPMPSPRPQPSATRNTHITPTLTSRRLAHDPG